MASLYQNTIEGFLYEGVKRGEIHFLIEGALTGLASWNQAEEAWDFLTGSWAHNSVDATGSWVDPNHLHSSSGTLQGEARIRGIAVSSFAFGTGTKGRQALSLCNRLRVSISIGNLERNLDLKVLSKRIEGDFMFLETNTVLVPAELQAALGVYFKYRGSEYKGYTCYPTDPEEVTINLFPYMPPVESEEYNPIFNNVISNVEGTVARKVEPFTLENVFVGSEDANMLYDGWYSDWNSSTQYSQSLEGSSSYGTRPTPGGTTANAGGAVGIYGLLPVVYLERATGPACIPDSFYTSIANISSRWLGSKNAEYRTYLGDKLDFTRKNIQECQQDIQQNADKGLYLIQQGSPLIIAEGETVTAAISGSLHGTGQSGSQIRGELQGTVTGSMSGYVTDIPLTNQILSYYSSSKSVTDHEIWTTGEVHAEGTGTIDYSSWGETSGGEVIGSRITLKGLTQFTGEYTYLLQTASNQTITTEFANASGSFRSWGTVTGIGTVNSTGSSREAVALDAFLPGTADRQFTDPGYVYLEDANISRLALSNVISGNLQVNPSGSLYISGTIGRTAKNLSLHRFDGTLDIDSVTGQDIFIDHADQDGIILSNIETSEQTSTSFDAFTADIITVVPDFGGRTEFTLTNGQVNLASDGTMHVSLITQDQEYIRGSGSSDTGSLPNAVLRLFNGMGVGRREPLWDFSKIRTEIVGTLEDSVARPADHLAEGTALISGSFDGFTLEGTRKNLRSFRYQKLGDTAVPQTDIQQAIQMLSNLEAGLSFAKSAYERTGVQLSPSTITPQLVTKATLPQKVYDTMVTASQYIVPGETTPIWTSSLASRNLNFFDTGSSSRVGAQNFITGSLGAIEKLNLVLSSSLVDRRYKEKAGQYTYVYLDCSGVKYLEANLRDFSGSYIEVTGLEGSQTGSALSGSYRQLWGRFGEGTISQKSTKIQTTWVTPGQALTDRITPDRAVSVNPLLNTKYVGDTGGTNGVIYGAFDYTGYIKGGYEGNLVEGTIEGDLTGVITGIVDTGFIEGGPVQLTGVTRGNYAGAVKSGEFRGAMKNVQVTGNNLTGNVTLEGLLSGVEEFPLEGILTGSALNVALPERCSFNVTASSMGTNQLGFHIPDKGTATGELNIPPDYMNEKEEAIIVPGQTTWYTGSVPISPDPVTGYLLEGGSTTFVEIPHTLYSENIQIYPRITSPTEEIISGALVQLEEVPAFDSIVARVTVPSGADCNIPLGSYFLLQREATWSGTQIAPTAVDISGEKIDIDAFLAGTVSGSMVIGSDGQVTLLGKQDTFSFEEEENKSNISGQYLFSGSMIVTTPESDPFSGKVSAVPVSQQISGTFDVTLEEPTYLDLEMSGNLKNYSGHSLVRGLVQVESGSKGNLVEGRDRPFFTIQNFSGSVFPEDTTAEAIQNMNISDMDITGLGFTSGMSLVQYSTGSFGTVKEQEYVQNTLSLPQIGDIVYRTVEGRARIVSSKLYCPDLNALLTVNDRGTVTGAEYLSQIQ